MKPILYGNKESKSTEKVLGMLDDSKISYEYREIISIDSVEGELLVALTNSSELPQLFIGGDSFVGYDAISRYLRN